MKVIAMKIKLRNRLEVLMKDSGVNTFEEMAQRLTQRQGCKINRTSLSRKFRDEDVTLSLSLIEAICNELQCLPGDLFVTDVSDAAQGYVDELRSRLQPFRYGVIRLQKSGAEVSEGADSDRAASTASAAAKSADKSVTKSRPAVDLDDIVGPRVSHLHAGKLKGKS